MKKIKLILVCLVAILVLMTGCSHRGAEEKEKLSYYNYITPIDMSKVDAKNTSKLREISSKVHPMSGENRLGAEETAVVGNGNIRVKTAFERVENINEVGDVDSIRAVVTLDVLSKDGNILSQEEFDKTFEPLYAYFSDTYGVDRDKLQAFISGERARYDKKTKEVPLDLERDHKISDDGILNTNPEYKDLPVEEKIVKEIGFFDSIRSEPGTGEDYENISLHFTLRGDFDNSLENLDRITQYSADYFAKKIEGATVNFAIKTSNSNMKNNFIVETRLNTLDENSLNSGGKLGSAVAISNVYTGSSNDEDIDPDERKVSEEEVDMAMSQLPPSIRAKAKASFEKNVLPLYGTNTARHAVSLIDSKDFSLMLNASAGTVVVDFASKVDHNGELAK